jgi:hypothetical protein
MSSEVRESFTLTAVVSGRPDRQRRSAVEDVSGTVEMTKSYPVVFTVRCWMNTAVAWSWEISCTPVMPPCDAAPYSAGSGDMTKSDVDPVSADGGATGTADSTSNSVLRSRFSVVGSAVLFEAGASAA